jgi:L-threonylcarbamoyladenylate synthase
LAGLQEQVFEMTVRLGTELLTADSAAIAAAARILARGGLVAFPTETVYGLGADATDAEAVARLYRAKGRPAFNPLIAHVADLAAAERIGRFNADALKLARAFWPGALTLVLPKAEGCTVSELATAGLDTVAVRVPDHKVAQAVLSAFGRPVVAPSANISGHVSPTTASHVMADLEGRIDLVIDGGETRVGVESTIVACLEQPTLLRPGGIKRADIERVLGHALATEHDASEAPLAPGMLASHYAPHARVRVNATHVEPGEALLTFGPDYLPGASFDTRVLHLSPTGCMIEAAAKLFRHLRTFDELGATSIAVMPIPGEGLGEAINDRLGRAAAPKPR